MLEVILWETRNRRANGRTNITGLAPTGTLTVGIMITSIMITGIRIADIIPGTAAISTTDTITDTITGTVTTAIIIMRPTIREVFCLL